MIPEHRGGELISMLSKLKMCVDREVFILAYHVWMDEGTKWIGDQVTALFFPNHAKSHSLCVMIGLSYLDSSKEAAPRVVEFKMCAMSFVPLL